MTGDIAKGRRPRIGLLWRGERNADPYSTSGAERLGALMAALREMNAEVEPVVYQDDALDSVREQLMNLDGVLVWVNPIQDGANRAFLDALLREASSKGLWVSAHPEVIIKLGTKEVLWRTCHLGWGADTDLYRDASDFRERFPNALARDTVRVLKQARGNGGNGVWKVVLDNSISSSDKPFGPFTMVRVQHALERADAKIEGLRLGEFLEAKSAAPPAPTRFTEILMNRSFRNEGCPPLAGSSSGR